MVKDERDAIRRTLAGDPDAYRVLMERYFVQVHRIAYRITGDEADAEEVAQEAFVRGYNKLADFRMDAQFSTWVTRIAMNTALNLVERRTREVTHAATAIDDTAVQVASHAATPERELLDAETASLRRAAMATLTPMERTAFTMRHMEDLPVAEIAVALKIQPNAAKQAIFRAVGKLRRALAPVSANVSGANA